ncbi:hypothetical protein EG329_001227 [Mollisiaceae sp. DMI_Dod_QoI]|nr:hypothetical protein EG329_001227 [Helotiales sp. DMI_Dod_QoI]
MALPIPVNSTILYLDNWKNGSLFPQIQNNFSYTAVYPNNTQDQGLSLAILANNIGLLTFNASGFNTSTSFILYDNASLASTFALAERLFDPNASRFPLTCVYPMSGQYDTLSRALFYVLMIFSLVFRRHIWISVAALGTAMTYAAVSAIHLFTLVGYFRFSETEPSPNTNSATEFADVDFVGILPNLTASAIMLTPILLWSTTVRKNEAQSIVVWWGVLIFAALACLLFKFNGFYLDELESFAICASDCIPETNLESLTFPFAVYQRCGCIDFCGTLSPIAPMRKGANMVPWFDAVRSENIVSRPGFQRIWIVNIVALVFIAIYGVMGLIVSRFNPDEVRNGIFRFFNSDLRLWLKVLFEGDREARALNYFKVQEKDTRRTIWKMCKYCFAKLIATLFSLTAGATAIICPAVFVSTVVANEILLQAYPVSEFSDAVGAWGTWVGAMLVLIAAVINKYSGSWVKTLKIIVYSVWRLVKYSKEDRTRLYPKREGWSVSKRLQLFGLVLSSPLVHSWWSLARGFWTLKTTIHFFLVWWKDTETISQQRGKEISEAWEAELVKVPGGKPTCRCYPCKHDEEKRAKAEEEEEKEKAQGQGYNADHGTSSTAVLSGAAYVPLSTTSGSPLPTKAATMAIDETPSRDPSRPPSPSEIPLPTPRSTFARQNTDLSMA